MWGMKVGCKGTSGCHAASRSCMTPAVKTQALPGSITATPCSFLRKKVRQFNSQQEMLPGMVSLHAEGRQAKLWEAESFLLCWSQHLPGWMKWLYHPPHAASVIETMKGRALSPPPEAEAAATGAGRSSEMKVFRQPVTTGFHCECKLLQKSPSPSHLVQGLCWWHILPSPLEPLRMNIYSKIFQQLWSSKYALRKWLLLQQLQFHFLGVADQYLSGKVNAQKKDSCLNNSVSFLPKTVLLAHQGCIFSDRIWDLCLLYNTQLSVLNAFPIVPSIVPSLHSPCFDLPFQGCSFPVLAAVHLVTTYRAGHFLCGLDISCIIAPYVLFSYLLDLKSFLLQYFIAFAFHTKLAIYFHFLSGHAIPHTPKTLNGDSFFF